MGKPLDEFLEPFLTGASIPGEDSIPEPLLEAMALLIGRYMEDYMSPKACAPVAALVLLASDSGYIAHNECQQK